MDLRERLTGETSAFVDRLLAATEAATAHVRLEAEARISALRAEIEESRTQLETERTRAAALLGQLGAETSRNSALATDFEAASARTATLTSDLQAAAGRISALETHLERGTSRLTALTSQLEEATARNAVLTGHLQTETARATALAGELESTAGALRAAEEARSKADASVEGASSEVRSLREMLESARTEAIRNSEALEAEAAQKALLQQAHETTVADLEARLEAAVASTKSLELSLADAEGKAREAATVADEVQPLRRQLEEQTESLRKTEVQVEAAKAAVARMRAELTEAQAITDAAGAEMSLLRGRVGQLSSVLAAAATSLDAIGSVKTVAELLATLVRELATGFKRVAIFRVKGNHLEGDLAVGLDESVDIQKIVVPLSLSSVMTKAATGGGIQQAAREEIGDSRPPFGGSPELVVAAPLLFEGEVLAVVYADSDTVVGDAYSAFAGVLVRHANAVLTGFALELRTSRQLREYARTLLQEVDSMFTADIEAGVPEPARVRRLRANVGFARDLYAQRAALESPLAANLLEDEIGRMRRGADASSPFAHALAADLDFSDDLLRPAAVSG